MKLFVWICAGFGFLTAVLGGFALLPLSYGCCSARASNERNASATLKMLASAQRDFRDNDRDGDGRREYWRADVAGLYTLLPPGDSDPIRLIESSAAAADAAPRLTPGPGSPKAGYYFKALAHADEDPDAPDPKRFAFCAFPAAYPDSGRKTFILAEGGVVYAKDLRRGPPVFFPDPRTLTRDWATLD